MANTEFNAGPVNVRSIEHLLIISLRHLPEASDSLATALQAAGLAGTPGPGLVLGQSPWALWISPSEVILLANNQMQANAAKAALADSQLACAVDQSDALLALDLRGPQLDDLLLRLIDSRSLPGVPGYAVRVRLADIAVILIRQTPDRLWLLVERPQSHYLTNWLKHAGTAL
jgi:heterotetrameric sarcosine oxidase gamma subunit